MKTTELIEKIRADVTEVQKNGQQAIMVDNLIKYLDECDLEDSSEQKAMIETLKANHSEKLEMMKLNGSFSIEMFKSVITTGQSAINACMIINGGAAIALLAFLGNILTKNQAENAQAIPSLVVALHFFGFGVLAAALTYALTYITQFFYGESILSSKKHILRIGIFFHLLSIASALYSLYLFYKGVSFEIVPFGL